MPLVKQGRITTDPFVRVADGAELPGDGAVLVTAERFLADPEALLRRSGKLGVIWPNNRSLEDLVPHLDRLASVALVFPTFRDGRAYSQAFLLRRRLGFTGDIRATGDVLIDQLVQMERTGFSSAVLKEGVDASDAQRQFDRFNAFYQGDAVQPAPHFAAGA